LRLQQKAVELLITWFVTDDIIYSIKRLLEDNEFVVDSYTDPTLALSNFKPRLYDLLILDIKMPNMNGLNLLSDHCLTRTG
jgi:DNA-binding response OmpR family regulator